MNKRRFIPPLKFSKLYLFELPPQLLQGHPLRMFAYIRRQQRQTIHVIVSLQLDPTHRHQFSTKINHLKVKQNCHNVFNLR